jgi:diacylglycerol kinase (ATP)
MKGRAVVILNPASGRGKGRKAAPLIRKEFAGIGMSDFWETAARGDESALVRRALDEGFGTILAAGGDGTWSNVGRAILREGAGRDIALGLIAAGTGNDFAKSVGAPAMDYRKTAELVAQDATRWVDAGRIGNDFFLNSVGFGFDAAVLATIESMSWLRGSAVYTIAALRQLFTFRGISIAVDAAAPQRPMMLIVANGGYLGGAFHIAPSSRVDDGLLDTVSIGDMPALGRLRLFGAAMKGEHTGNAAVRVERCRSITLQFECAPACQRDGELDQLTERMVTLSCQPSALRIVAASREPAPVQAEHSNSNDISTGSTT